MKMLDRLFKINKAAKQTAFEEVAWTSHRVAADDYGHQLSGIIFRLHGPTIKMTDSTQAADKSIISFAANVLGGQFQRVNDLQMIGYGETSHTKDHTYFQFIDLLLPDAPKPPKYMVAEINGDGYQYIPSCDCPLIIVKPLDTKDSEADALQEAWSVHLPLDATLDNEDAIKAKAMELLHDYLSDREDRDRSFIFLDADHHVGHGMADDGATKIAVINAVANISDGGE